MKRKIIYIINSLMFVLSISNFKQSNETSYAYSQIKSYNTLSLKNNSINKKTMIEIKDENLLKAINNQLGKGDVLTAITLDEIENLTILDATSRNISSLSGIENAINLRELKLYNNNISSIEELRYLENLEKLYLGDSFQYGNTVSNLEPISNLVSLKELDISRNNILNLNSLENLNQLTHLSIASNNLYSIDGVENLINLTNLDFHDNNITSIEPLRNLRKITHLYAGKLYENNSGYKEYGNNIEDISPLEDMSELIELQLGGNNIEDISILSNLTNLNILWLQRNNICNIDSLSALSKLNTLWLYDNQIEDISALRNLTNLETLGLYINNITDISSLKNLTNLRILNLRNNAISSISSLENLTNLTELYLSNNSISDIYSLRNMVNLRTLNLSGNNISDIESLEKISNLKILYLGEKNGDGNNIESIESLKNMINLEQLSISRNRVSSLHYLNNLQKLKILYVSSNELTSLEGLENLNNLVLLDFHDNNITSLEPIRNITSLVRLYAGKAYSYKDSWKEYGNQIEDISPLSNLVNLTCLELGNNNISNIDALKNLTNLNELWLQGNNISNLKSLEKLIGLNTLWLYRNQIKDVYFLKDLINLRTLGLYLNNIEDISSLKNLINLNNLNVRNNKISDISVFENFTNLKDFRFDNQSVEISLTANLDNNYNLYIDNPIKTVQNSNLIINNISNNGKFEEDLISWNNLSAGNHLLSMDFSSTVNINNIIKEFNGTLRVNVEIVLDNLPKITTSSYVNEDDMSIYISIAKRNSLSNIESLKHNNVIINELPYSFKYDIDDKSNNIIEVYSSDGYSSIYCIHADDIIMDTLSKYLDLIEEKSDVKYRSYIRTIFNQLSESSNKDLLQNRLDLMNLSLLELEKKIYSLSTDIYIKPENNIYMTLSTNFITFEDFSQVEDLEKLKAIELTINSSLPYQLNSYLLSEIENVDGTKTIDKSVLGIKDNSNDEYKSFNNINEKLIIIDNGESGKSNKHNIDLKLFKGHFYEADIYKTVIKFEAEQK